MAIITDITTERGYVYRNQYVNVYDVIAKKNEMTVNVGIYMTEQDYRDGMPPHRIDTLSGQPFDMFSEQNLWQQAYVAIKNHWPDSQDVL